MDNGQWIMQNAKCKMISGNVSFFPVIARSRYFCLLFAFSAAIMKLNINNFQFSIFNF